MHHTYAPVEAGSFTLAPFPLIDRNWIDPQGRDFLHFGPNDGGIRRGDSDETGDNEARPTERGSGSAHGTVDDTALGGNTSISHPTSSHFDLESEREDLDGIEIMQADDGRLGLTNTDRVPADDWAADTGNTAVPDAEE